MGKKHLQILMSWGGKGKISLLLAFCLWVVAAKGEPDAPGPVTVLFTSDRQAELSTCGCSIDQLGGLSRVPAALASQGVLFSAKPTADLWLEGGDLFFSTTGLSEERLRSEREKAELIAAIYKKWGVAVMTPGPKDLAGGVSELKRLAAAAQMKLVSANLASASGELLFAPYTVEIRRGVKIGVVGISGPELFGRLNEVKVLQANERLAEAVKKARGEGAQFVFVLSQSGLALDKELAARSEADFWVSGAATDNLPQPLVMGRTKLIQMLPQGQQVGLLTLKGSELGEYRQIDVKQSLPEDKTIQRGVDGLKKKRIKEALRGGVVPGKDKKAAFVANYETCRTCHAKQVEFWEGTKHASAYLVLFSKNQHFDPECITCHTLGFKQNPQFQKIAHPLVLKAVETKPGEPFVEKLMSQIFAKAKVVGPIDSREEPEKFARLKKEYHASLAELNGAGKLEKVFMGVQCEHCHGNRSGHPGKVRRLGKVNESSCRGCHRPPNAGEFDPAMIPKVACPSLGS